MNHLTHDQLSALLDDALSASDRAACEAHLAGCEVCRAQLAELSALDGGLAGSLTHDPGEAYFAKFADRVQARIASQAATATPAVARPRASWRELFSLRRLSLAGGTVALLITAGLAWMRFQQQDDAARALHAAAPRSAMESRLEQRETPAPAAEQVPPPVASREAARQELRTPAGSLVRDQRPGSAPSATGNERARKVRTLANGESVPVKRAAPREPAAFAAPQGAAADAQVPSANENEARNVPAPAAASPAPAPKSAIAQIKQRAVAPATEQATEKPESTRGLTWGATKSLYDGGPPRPLAKDALSAGSRADSASALHFRGGLADDGKLQREESTALAVQCGAVRDSRGAPVGGAQLTLLGRTARSTRSAADGTFCLPQAVAGDTLVILHVGFEPVRVLLTNTSALAISLQPVGTLGSKAGMLLGGRSERDLAGAFAPAPDVYADQPPAVRLAVSQARELSASARRVRTAEAYERAAERWDRIGALASGKVSLDARFQHLAMLREAYRIAPSPTRGTRLRAALAAFVAAAPRTLPERATALQWQAELGAPAPR